MELVKYGIYSSCLFFFKTVEDYFVDKKKKVEDYFGMFSL